MSTKGKAKTKGNKTKAKAAEAAMRAASGTATGLETIGVIRPAVDGIPPFHPLADVDMLMEGGDYAALVENIRVHGLRYRVVLYQDMLLDGRNRARACAEAGVDLLFTTMAFGSDAEAKAYLDSANLHRRHLTPEQKNERIAARLKANPSASDRQVAEKTHTTRPRVARVRRKLEKSGDVARSSHVSDTKGRQQPRRKSKPVAAARATRPAEQSVDKSEPWRAEPELAAYVAADRAWKRGELSPALQDGASAGEDARLRARIDELNTEVRRLEIKVSGLEVENNEQRLEIGQLKSVAVELGTSTSTIINAADIGGALAILVNFGRIKLQDFIVADIETLDPIDILELANNLTDIANDIKKEKAKRKAAKPVEPEKAPQTATAKACEDYTKIPDDLSLPECLKRTEQGADVS